MFELKITSNEVMDGGTSTVSWCVDTETIKFLADHEINDPQVVIVVAPEGRTYNAFKEFRTVVPMKDLLAYINFRAQGPNKIFGFITFKSKSKAKSWFLTRARGAYVTDLIISDGSDYCHGYNKETCKEYTLLCAEPLSVIVPAGCFASEPAAWEKTWVNHYFREKSIDQCDFRRRRLLAYSLQPVVLLGDWFARLFIFLVALLIGARNISVKPLFHLLSMSIGDQSDSVEGGSYFIREVPEDKIDSWLPNNFGEGFSFVVRKFWTLPFIPIFVIPMAIVTFLHGWHLLFTVIMGVAILLVIVLVVAFVATGGVDWAWEAVTQALGHRSEGPWYLDQEEMDLLTCTDKKAPLTFAKLPSKKKTLHLRFKDLKSKVCKPFSV